MWVHGRTIFCGAGAALQVLRRLGLETLSICGRRSIPTSCLPECACCYSCPAKIHVAAFRNIFLLQLVGKSPGTTKRLYAVRMGSQGLQSQDRGTWAHMCTQ